MDFLYGSVGIGTGYLERQTVLSPELFHLTINHTIQTKFFAEVFDSYFEMPAVDWSLC
jgi:hypothetical protein